MTLTRISVRQDICHGKPCIQGTRIQVAQVLDLVGAGKSFEAITSDYFPDLTAEDIRACIEFARDPVWWVGFGLQPALAGFLGACTGFCDKPAEAGCRLKPAPHPQMSHRAATLFA
jgi:uncharacterized protein (DUF433 family)